MSFLLFQIKPDTLNFRTDSTPEQMQKVEKATDSLAPCPLGPMKDKGRVPHRGGLTIWALGQCPGAHHQREPTKLPKNNANQQKNASEKAEPSLDDKRNIVMK